jgi:phosphomannomutase / phosphoglucomutase
MLKTTAATHIPSHVFKAYDIRGVVATDLTPELTRLIGHAFAEQMLAVGKTQCVVGRDGRLTGPALIKALTEGLMAGGVNVIDIGVVATPMVYFATHYFDTGTGIMITGSHNPPEYNGLKMMLDTNSFYGEQIQGLRARVQAIAASSPAASANKTTLREVDISQAYIDRIVSDIKLQGAIKVAVDCGNGSPGAYAPKLLRALGCEVDELFCEVDGHFPNHHPDPAKPENLLDLIAHLKRSDCEIGLAFDGDGDRLGVVTQEGQIIWPDRLMMLFAREVLAACPGAPIIYDVKCSRLLTREIEKAGGQALMWKTGHSLIKTKMKEVGSPLGGEMSGHIFFKHRWYGFDDALYSAARLLEILSRAKSQGQNITKLLNELPNSHSTPELHVVCEEGEPFTLVDKLKLASKELFPDAIKTITVDGLRVEWADGFGLARPSNTTPVVVLRFEADSAASLMRIQAAFTVVLKQFKPQMQAFV